MTAQQPGDVKVLFLAGKGRSGGTLLASLLGQLPGFFNIGELNRLWDWGLVSNYRCGCGLPGAGVPDVARDPRSGRPAARDGRGHRAARSARRGSTSRRRRSCGGRACCGCCAPGRAQPRELGGARPVHRGVVGRLPRASRTSPARVSSSTRRACRSSRSRSASCPASTCASRRSSAIRAPSCTRGSDRSSRTDRDTGEYMPKFSASFSTTSWLARNLVVEAIRRRGPVEVVQYDAMARDPAAVLRQLAEFVGEPAGDLEFLTSETATIAPTHSVGGNPVRMTSGAITIEPDEEWRRRDRAARPRRRDRDRAAAAPPLRAPGSQRRPWRGDAAPTADATGEEQHASLAALPTLTTNAWLRFDTIRHDLRDRAAEHGARDRRRRGRARLLARAPLHVHRRRARRPVTRGRRGPDRRRRPRQDQRAARRRRRPRVRPRVRVRGARAHRRRRARARSSGASTCGRRAGCS